MPGARLSRHSPPRATSTHRRNSKPSPRSHPSPRRLPSLPSLRTPTRRSRRAWLVRPPRATHSPSPSKLPLQLSQASQQNPAIMQRRSRPASAPMRACRLALRKPQRAMGSRRVATALSRRKRSPPAALLGRTAPSPVRPRSEFFTVSEI